MTKKTAKRKAPKADDAEQQAEVTPPTGYAKTMDLRFIDGQLHQKYESPHAGSDPEHWQPIEAWETGEEDPDTGESGTHRTLSTK